MKIRVKYNGGKFHDRVDEIESEDAPISIRVKVSDCEYAFYSIQSSEQIGDEPYLYWYEGNELVIS